MGRAPCCDKANVKKGPWSPEEDAKLKEFIDKFGTGGNWIALPQKAGLKRCGKSCRLRWLNYLRPNIKHGEFSDEEDRIICTLYASIGSRWSIIAAQLPGRTDNDIKNYWNTKLKKKLMGLNNLTIPSSNFPEKLFNISHNNNHHNFQAQLSHPLSSLSQIYTDHNFYNNSFYNFQPPKSPSLTPLESSYNILAPQSLNFMTPTAQYSYYHHQQGQDNNPGSVGFQCYPDKINNNNNSNMLVFGGNETSCTSSSDGSYGRDRRHHVKQESDRCDNNNNLFQGYSLGDRRVGRIDHGDAALDGITINDVVPNRELECDLEEVKQLVSSTGNSNLLFNVHDNDDENNTHEKGLYYYY